MLQSLLRYKYTYKEIGFKKAFKEMIAGSKDLLERKRMMQNEKKI